jgi:hypothetical protein
MTVRISHEIESRSEFSLLCNWRRLYRAIEVGVDRADFAVEFLKRWRGHNYFGIDTYGQYPEFPWSRDADFLMAVSRLERTGANVKLVKEESIACAESMKAYDGGYFADLKNADFIYLDGDHSYEAVLRDIVAWWDLVSGRGVLAGHDYDEQHPGVMRAVNEFFHDKDVFITQDSPASWYVYKNGIPSGEWSRIEAIECENREE